MLSCPSEKRGTAQLVVYQTAFSCAYFFTFLWIYFHVSPFNFEYKM